MKIKIINDEQYKFFREMLGLSPSLNSYDEFEIEEDNSIYISGKKVYVEVYVGIGKIEEGMFLKIVGSRFEQEIVKINLTIFMNKAAD